MLNLRWPTPNGRPPAAVVIGLLLIIALLWLSAPLAEISATRLITSIGPAFHFLGQLLSPPDWSYLPDLGKRLLETIEMTLLGTAIAAVLSFPLGILAARNASPFPAVFHFFRGLLSLIRALPELVWALVFVSAVGLGPLAGIMALALVTVGFLGKFIAESIEVVSDKAVEGVAATGAKRLQVIRYAMIPQAMPDFVGTLLYVLDHNLRAASILGLVGAGGIGYDMVMSMRLFQYERITMILVSIYLIVTLLDRLSDALRQRMIGRQFHA